MVRNFAHLSIEAQDKMKARNVVLDLLKAKYANNLLNCASGTVIRESFIIHYPFANYSDVNTM